MKKIPIIDDFLYLIYDEIFLNKLFSEKHYNAYDEK
jgi:hypothetical protein